MSLYKHNRFAALFHGLVAALLLVAGAALLGWGVWLRRTDSGAPGELQYAGTDTLSVALEAGWGAIGIGGFLLLTGVASVLSLARGWAGGAFRMLYTVIGTVVAIALLCVCAGAATAAHAGGRDATRAFVEDAWARTASVAPDDVCALETRLECRGLFDRDCIRCPTGLEGAACAATPGCVRCDAGASSDVGCYPKIAAELRRVFRPVAIMAGLLSAVVIADLVVTCVV